MTSSKSLQQAIADITIWRKGRTTRAAQALLMLHVLAGYQQGHGRLFDYGSEVRDPLHSLLSDLDRNARSIARICPSGAYREMGSGSYKTPNIAQHPAAANSPLPENWMR